MGGISFLYASILDCILYPTALSSDRRPPYFQRNSALGRSSSELYISKMASQMITVAKAVHLDCHGY